MELTFANPGLLAGLALLALPLLAHLGGRRRLVRVPFPAVRFLQAAQRTLRRRWLLDDLLLLALRMAALAALVLLFTRPEVLRAVRVDAASATALDTVLVVDRSMTTRAAGGGRTVFERLVGRGIELIEEMEPGTRVALVWMDHDAHLEGVGMTRDRGDLVAALRAAEPGFGATDLDAALALALDVLLRDGVLEGQVVVLGDGSATDLPGEALAASWPPGIALQYRDLSGAGAVNRWVAGVDQPPADQGISGLPVEVRIAGAPIRERPVPVDLYVEGLEPIRGSLGQDDDPGEAKRFTVISPGGGTVSARVELAGDDNPGDDVFPFFLRREGRQVVYLLGGEGGASARDDELYYLATALRPSAASLRGHEPIRVAVEELDDLPAQPGTVLLVCNVQASQALASGIRRLVGGGAGVLIAAGSLVDRDAYNRHLGDLLPAELGAVKSRDESTFEASEVSLAPPDLDDPLWAPFRDGGLSTFGRVRFDRVVEVEPFLAGDSRVALRYSDGRAALLERRIGDGRVLLFTSTLDDDWSDLPVRGIFLPIVHQLVRCLAGELQRVPWQVVIVGDRPDLDAESAPEAPADALAYNLVGPADEVQALAAPSPLPVAEIPGHYRLVAESAAGPSIDIGRYCVRVSPAESEATPLDRVVLARRLPELVHVTEGSGADGEGEDRDRATVTRRVSLVPHLAFLLLVLLGIEAWVGGRGR